MQRFKIHRELSLLWEQLPHPPNTVVRWFAKKDGQRVGEYVESLSELKRVVEKYSTWNFYIQPNPSISKAGTRCSAKDVSHWSWFLLDVDPLLNSENPNPETVMEEALLWFGEWLGWDFKVNSPLLLDSGRGTQAWFRLEDSILSGDEDRQYISKLQQHWLRKIAKQVGTKFECRVDTTTSDLPRIMRCPGSINQKTGKMATIIRTCDSLTGIRRRMIDVAPKFTYEPPTERATLPAGLPWQILRPTLTLMAKNFLDYGAEHPGRHKAIHHTAKLLYEKGLDQPEVEKAINSGNKKCRPEPLDSKEIHRIINDVFRKGIDGVFTAKEDMGNSSL